MLINISLAADRVPLDHESDDDDDAIDSAKFFSPGDVITRYRKCATDGLFEPFKTRCICICRDAGFMRGHGTYMKNGTLYASVAGVVQRVNKLVSVIPLKTKYQGEIGDVIVGRITEVQQKRWKVDVNGRLDAILQLSSVNLPGGELRRRSAEDELAMRKYLQEGDLISAEVQNVHSDGAVTLHTRSLKYGKLSQGTLLRVSPSLVKRRKTHFHQLPCGANVILGNNGYIWISPAAMSEDETGGFAQNLSVVPKTERVVLSRLRNCILALASNGIMLWDTSLTYAYDASQKFQAQELLREEVMEEVAEITRHQLDVVAMEH